MSEPSREHVEAVARIIADDWNPDRDPILTAMFSDYAETILTSTDPAVLDAMQDALVRAGRLRESRTEWGIQRPAPYEGVISDEFWKRDAAERSRDIIQSGREGEWHLVTRRVLVTEWQEVEP